MQHEAMMSMSPMFFALAVTCAVIGSYHDLRERRIPNRLTGPALLVALVLHLVYGGWAACLLSLCAATVAGSVTLLFFLAGGMGAGDVKLMAAVGAWMGLGALPGFLLATAICGAMLACGIALRHGRLRATLANVFVLIGHHHRRGLVPHSEHNLHAAKTLRMPFAIPIAAGCFIVAAMHTWSV